MLPGVQLLGRAKNLEWPLYKLWIEGSFTGLELSAAQCGSLQSEHTTGEGKSNCLLHQQSRGNKQDFKVQSEELTMKSDNTKLKTQIFQWQWQEKLLVDNSELYLILGWNSCLVRNTNCLSLFIRIFRQLLSQLFCQMSVFYRQHEGHEAEGLGAEVSLDSGAGQLERH